MANKYKWNICPRCKLPYIPYKEHQVYCSFLCERLVKEENRREINMGGYEKDFEQSRLKEWNEHGAYYPASIIHRGPIINAEKRLLQNRIREIFLLLDNKPVQYLDALNIKRFATDLAVPLTVLIRYTFQYKDVDIIIEHIHGVEYKNAFDRFFDRHPICYSTYDCEFTYNGQVIQQDHIRVKDIFNNLYRDFTKKIDDMDLELDAKIKELNELKLI